MLRAPLKGHAAGAARSRGAPAAGLPAGITVVLEVFGPGSLDRWEADRVMVREESEGAGLSVPGGAVLSPRAGPLPLPPRARRLLVRGQGEVPGSEVVLRGSQGRVQQLALERSRAAGEWLAAPVPPGDWTLTSLTIAPAASDEALVRELVVEAAVGSGLFALAREEAGGAGKALRVEIVNLGAEAEHAVLESAGGSRLAEADLAPGGRAVLRLSSVVEPLLSGGAAVFFR